HSLCLLPAHIFQRDAVTQLQSTVTVNEGEAVHLQCNYTTTSTFPDLFWYRHYANKAPEYILWTDKRNNPRQADFAKDRFTTHVDEAERTVPLSISQVRFTDSTVYYCALSPTEAQISDSASETGLLFECVTFTNPNHQISPHNTTNPSSTDTCPVLSLPSCQFEGTWTQICTDSGPSAIAGDKTLESFPDRQ
uniref:Ig-like domain-containing protein n=1 Tax=Callorhinchus milii TaxID=7868 RepID=A0A4W3GJS7_CALMI